MGKEKIQCVGEKKTDNEVVDEVLETLDLNAFYSVEDFAKRVGDDDENLSDETLRLFCIIINRGGQSFKEKGEEWAEWTPAAVREWRAAGGKIGYWYVGAKVKKEDGTSELVTEILQKCEIGGGGESDKKLELAKAALAAAMEARSEPPAYNVNILPPKNRRAEAVGLATGCYHIGVGKDIYENRVVLHNELAIGSIASFLKRNHVDCFSIQGDFTDLSTLSKFSQKSNRFSGSITGTFQTGNNILTDLASSTREDTRRVLVTGNHDDPRVINYMYGNNITAAIADAIPANEELATFDYERMLKPKQAGFEYYPGYPASKFIFNSDENGNATRNSLLLPHGDIWGTAGNVAYKYSKEYPLTNMIVFHDHRDNEYAFTDPNTGQVYRYMVAGGLVERDGRVDARKAGVAHGGLYIPRWQQWQSSIVYWEYFPNRNPQYKFERLSVESGSIVWRNKEYAATKKMIVNMGNTKRNNKEGPKFRTK